MNDNSKQPSPDYVNRVNRAIDYILHNLREPIRLEDLARVAHFSPFHFHRVFKGFVGETLSQFVKRMRLERALFLMSHQKHLSLTEIALECGFASSSDFSRSFKQRYDVPPSVFDLKLYRDTRREELKASGGTEEMAHLLKRLPVGENPDGFEARIRELPARCVAYLRVFDPYRPNVASDAVLKMIEWAEARNLADGQWLGYMWEDPEVVPLADCRYDVGLVVPGVKAEGEIGRMDFPAMMVAEVTIRGGIDLEMRALDWLFLTWLPNSKYLPAEHPCFESWIGRPFAHGYEYFELKVQIPIVRA